VYEDLEPIAQLKFGKEMNAIAEQTRLSVQEAKSRFAAMTGTGIRSGQHEASLARIRIAGIERMGRVLFDIWVDLITKRNGKISRADVAFIAHKMEQFVGAQKSNLRNVFSLERGAAVPSLVEEADNRMNAVAASARRDMEIMARESEAFLRKSEESVKQAPKKRFSPGRRVLVGMGNRPATVQSVADVPSTLGEYVHEVLVDSDQGVHRVLGCDLQPVPDLDEDLRGNRTAIHIHNSNVANINLGSQIGVINANLQSLTRGDETQQEFARAIEQLAQAVASESALEEAQKQEIVEAITTISEEASKKPGERSNATLKALAAWIPTAISAANNLVTLWRSTGPTIKAFFGIN
jgi:hypothetical protein